MSDSGFSSQKLNLTLALCAILISVASFYATYLQANAAEKQVKAMTLPLLQYETSNLDDKTYKRVIQFTIANGGVGPALIKNLNFNYKNKRYKNIPQVINACCSNEYAEYRQQASVGLSQGGDVTRAVVNRILPAQQEIKFYELYDGEITNKLWQKLNDERFQLRVSGCYCSLLDECFNMEENGIVKPIKFCPVD